MRAVVHCTDAVFSQHSPLLDQLMELKAFGSLSAYDEPMPLMRLAICGWKGYDDLERCSKSLLVKYLLERVDEWSSKEEELRKSPVLMAIGTMDTECVKVLRELGYDDHDMTDAFFKMCGDRETYAFAFSRLWTVSGSVSDASLFD